MIHRRWTRPFPDGAILRADVRIPEGPPPRAAVVLVHGFKGFRTWGFFPWLAQRLGDAGIATVVPDLSLNGIGSTPGEFTELEAFARNTFTREVEEVGVLLDALRDGGLLPMVPERIGLFGHSRGGGGAILAGARGGVDALVTWAAVATFHRWPEETLESWRAEGRIHVLNGRTGQQMPLDLTLLEDLEAHPEALDIEGAAARIQAPWLILHGGDDATVTPADARRLARASPEARLHLVEGAGHTLGAAHPLISVPPTLEEAAGLTVDHFRRHLLGDEDGGDGSLG
jgi:pimeloyl-ACP methyl ester carboxylesterase